MSYNESVWTSEHEVPPWEHYFTTFNPLHQPCPFKLPTSGTMDVGCHLANELKTCHEQPNCHNFHVSGIAIVSILHGYSRHRRMIGSFTVTAAVLVITFCMIASFDGLDAVAWVIGRTTALLQQSSVVQSLKYPAWPGVRPHSHWHKYQLRVIHPSETRTSGALTVTRTSTNTCDSVAIKNVMKIVKCFEFVAKVYSSIADNVG